MGYTYLPSQESNSNKFDVSTLGLQICYVLKSITNIFASTFLVSFIVHINKAEPLSASLSSISLYYIAFYLTFSIIYFLCSFIVDKTNRVWMYRLGILIKGIFIVSVVFIGKELSKFVLLAGFIGGFANGVFYSAFNVLKGEMVPRRQMSKFSAVNAVFNKVVNIVFPIVLGALIDFSSYTYVAIGVLILTIIELSVTFMIKSKKPEGSSFDFFKFIKSLKLKDPNTKRIKNIYSLALLYGARTLIGTLFSIVTIYTFKTNLNLGIFTSISAIISVASLLIIKRFTKEGKRAWLIVMLISILVGSTILVAFNMNNWTYILFNISQAIAICFSDFCFDVERTVIVKKTGHYSDTAEHQCIVELCLSLSRILSFVIMFVMGICFDVLGMKIMLIVSSLIVSVSMILMMFIEKTESKYPFENIPEANQNEKMIENQTSASLSFIDENVKDNKES